MHEKKSSTITIAVILAVIFIVGLYTLNGFRENIRQGDNGTDIAKLQPDGEIPYTDLSGEPVDLADFAGKTLVINAWASWCPFCIEELPDMAQLAKEYLDDDVVVIAINRKESPNTAKAFVKHVGSPKDIVFLLDSEDRFYKSIGGFSMPETIFYDKDGNISLHKRGVMNLEEMKSHLDKALRVTNE